MKPFLLLLCTTLAAAEDPCQIDVKLYRAESAEAIESVMRGYATPETEPAEVLDYDIDGDGVPEKVPFYKRPPGDAPDNAPWNVTILQLDEGEEPELPGFELITAPSVVTPFGTEASISIGDDTPVDYLEAVDDGHFALKHLVEPLGIAITVLPERLEDGVIRAHLKIASSSIAGRERLPGTGIEAGKATVSRTEMQMSVALREGIWLAAPMPVNGPDGPPVSGLLVFMRAQRHTSGPQASAATPPQYSTEAKFIAVTTKGDRKLKKILTLDDTIVEGELYALPAHGTEEECVVYFEELLGDLELLSAPRVTTMYGLDCPPATNAGPSAPEPAAEDRLSNKTAGTTASFFFRSEYSAPAKAIMLHEDDAFPDRSMELFDHYDDHTFSEWLHAAKGKPAVIADIATDYIESGEEEPTPVPYGIMLGISAVWDEANAVAHADAYLNNKIRKVEKNPGKNAPDLHTYFSDPARVQFTARNGETKVFYRRSIAAETYTLVFITIENIETTGAKVFYPDAPGEGSN